MRLNGTERSKSRVRGCSEHFKNKRKDMKPSVAFIDRSPRCWVLNININMNMTWQFIARSACCRVVLGGSGNPLAGKVLTIFHCHIGIILSSHCHHDHCMMNHLMIILSSHCADNIFSLQVPPGVPHICPISSAFLVSTDFFFRFYAASSPCEL